jgi:hypothetical protein
MLKMLRLIFGTSIVEVVFQTMFHTGLRPQVKSLLSCAQFTEPVRTSGRFTYYISVH